MLGCARSRWASALCVDTGRVPYRARLRCICTGCVEELGFLPLHPGLLCYWRSRRELTTQLNSASSF
ncbi:hypothetical protein JTE90_016699 [Oedothorax gibbosus]|uniref:Secreted protein n=1 Tax=Oedothorax gibbosus TaxID=931172 RepID=A0AAV6V1G2_9ARAC|nr:hypothetical protein JTE90_016699 [Oedothorax gibbosus]